MTYVHISREARQAFIQGQIRSELENLRRWKHRENEAISHILDIEAQLKMLEEKLNALLD